MARGWIKLERKLLQHWLWGKKPFSEGQAWVDLLLRVNHDGKKLAWNGHMIEIGRGEFMTSIRKLSDDWGWSRGKTERFLKLLENDQMVNRKRDGDGTLLTLVNYGSCQTGGPPTGTRTGQRRATGGPAADTNKNDKNVRKEKEEGACALGPLPGETGDERLDRIARLRR